jgi:penicillin G amidase
MRTFFKLLFWSGLLVGATAALTVWLYLRQASPKVDGAMQMPGAQASLRIERDGHGIPTIHATSLRDAAYGLGIVHAQDRRWQLETHRLIGSGRTAEAFGERSLDTDKFLRALGVKRTAQAQWERMQGESREVVQAYTAGINDTIAVTKSRPPEMVILGLRDEPWTPPDTLAWLIMMAWDLGGNWSNELLRMRLATKLPTQRVHELVPPYPGDPPVTSVDLAAFYKQLDVTSTMAAAALERLVAAAPPSGIEGVGSNNWVVGSKRSATGKPLLANDPHLKLSAPALWYFARIKIPGLDVAGASMPGTPGIVLGQNQHVAWGFTNTGPDVQDVYLERITPEDPGRYQTPDGTAAFETVDEVIKIKGRSDLRFVARRSRHGPVMSDAGTLNDLAGAKGKPAYALALRWTALDPEIDTVTAALGIMRADSLDAFVKASRGWVAPMQNMVVADATGRTGYVAAGRVPIRDAANDLKGYVPAPGWDARYDWIGTIDPDQTPREFDHPRGFVATANQRIHGTDYPYFISADWASPHRQRRIEQLLDSKPVFSLDDLRTVQADVHSLASEPLLPWLKRARSSHALAAAAQAQVANFDGTMTREQAAPAIYWAWLRHLTEGVLADELGAGFYDATLGTRQFRDAIEGILARDDAWWCDDKATPQAETCAQRSDTAFTLALEELHAKLGKDVASWQWGKLHVARSEHRPFSRVRWLAPLFEVRVPTGGDTFAVNHSRVAYKADATTGERYLNEHAASLRALYDVGDPSKSRVMHSTGQSGLPWSPHYRDFALPWSRIETVGLWNSAPPRAMLTVSPAPR